MKRSSKSALNAVYVVGGLAVANAAIGYLTSYARTGRLPGQNKLLDFNDSLLRYNPLAKLAQIGTAAMPSMTVTSSSTPITPLPAPVVTDQPTGTTTYFGSATR